MDMTCIVWLVEQALSTSFQEHNKKGGVNPIVWRLGIPAWVMSFEVSGKDGAAIEFVMLEYLCVSSLKLRFSGSHLVVFVVKQSGGR